MAVIETSRLTKRYGGQRGIEDVTLSVEGGEVFEFLGPNGAGKTTTARTLLDLLHPTAGTARIFGLDSRRDSVEIRARLGNLPAFAVRATGAVTPRRIGSVLSPHQARGRALGSGGATTPPALGAPPQRRVAHSAGGRAVAGSIPVAPADERPAKQRVRGAEVIGGSASE